MDAYRELFRRLADGAAPLLFHCHAGKDRTGIGAALLLHALGVPRELIREDYAVTESCLVRDQAALHPPGEPNLWAIDEVAHGPMLRADPAYLDAMFSKLDKDFGSVDGYLERALGVDRARREHLRDALLES
jgi:protein-tyrosine phosphatase